MIELRWFFKNEFSEEEMDTRQATINGAVLQYRKKIDTSPCDVHLIDPWSEWQDVPVVEEGK